MKKLTAGLIIVFLALAFAACKEKSAEQEQYVITSMAHNSRNSLDWGGIYGGKIKGINELGAPVKITLNYDGTYILSGGGVNKNGSFKWNESGGNITLVTETTPLYFKVGEGMLIQLDAAGTPLPGDYILIKTP